MTEISEGHFQITKTWEDHDTDHGPCGAYYVAELDMTIYLYDFCPDRVSFHKGYMGPSDI